MQKIRAASVGSVVLAFLASQHHMLHMLILTAGVGSAGAGVMTAVPALRRAMLGLSVLMAGYSLWQTLRGGRPRGMQWAGVVGGLVTLGLVGWSVAQFGV